MSAQVMSAVELFTPVTPLLAGRAPAQCRACVTIPVRNEEVTLAACLDALAGQRNLQGESLSRGSFEILLLLNNCTDRSLGIARRWGQAHPDVALHILERALLSEEAHVGTARRLLMDTAWHRLEGRRPKPCAILATDADSTVAPDWLAQNLLALERGADAVGGLIALQPAELAAMPAQVRCCYERDRRYAELIAELEDLLDPQPGDASPRHLDHFGSSLACTPEAYAAVGGMPAVSPLEDEAFVNRLRRANLFLRHEPAVRVFTSPRLQGRTVVGLAGQLRQWNELSGEAAHCVPSASFLAHRFRTLALLRGMFRTGEETAVLPVPEEYRRWVRTMLRTAADVPASFTPTDCDWLIEQSFVGRREQPIAETIPALETLLAELTKSAR